MAVENRLGTLEENMQIIMQGLANAGFFHHNPQNRPVQNHRHQEDRALKIDIPDFDGFSYDPSNYLDWEERLDQYFDIQKTPPDRQYKIAKVKMIKIAPTWLEGIQRRRERGGKPRISTWNKLKKYMRRKYVPPTYRQQLYVQFSTLNQGTKSVQEYVQEWERLAVKCDAQDEEELRVGRFIAGLREEIRSELIYTPDLTMHLAINTALEVERNLSRKKRLGNPVYNRATRTFTPGKPSNSMLPRRDTSNNNNKNTRPALKESMRTDTPAKEIVCLKCNGRGHYKRDCPNARAFTLREWEEIRQDTKPNKTLVSSNGQEEEIYPPNHNDEENDTCIEREDGTRQRVKGDVKAHCEEIVEAVCAEEIKDLEEVVKASCVEVVNDLKEVVEASCVEIVDDLEEVVETFCDLNIDGGSESKFVSKQLENELKLETKPASGAVNKQCLISFTLGSYADNILFNVLDMDACHLLLGRPWQYDRKTKHNGYTNTYTLNHNGKRKELIPLPPHQAIPPKPTKTPTLLITRRECDREIRGRRELYLLFTKEVSKAAPIPPRLKQLIDQYLDVFPTELPAKKHEYEMFSDFVEYVHISRFVEFNPTKIRGRIFSKKEGIQQTESSLGNTSKLIFLVSLFNIWVWFIMQVRRRAFILTCVMIMGNMISTLIRVFLLVSIVVVFFRIMCNLY